MIQQMVLTITRAWYGMAQGDTMTCHAVCYAQLCNVYKTWLSRAWHNIAHSTTQYTTAQQTQQFTYVTHDRAYHIA